MIIDFENIKLVDLTHTLSPEIPHWDEGCGFNTSTVIDYDDCSSDVKFRVQKLEAFSGIGTHMDAPSHCIPNAASIAELPLEKLIAPCVVINLSHHAQETYRASLDDISLFEKKHGLIKKNSFVIFYTGWGEYWSQPEKYRNNLVFPSISKEVAELLVKRNVAGIGIDTLSPDCSKNGFNEFPVHKIILGSGKYIIENIANANQLPPTGAHTLALPLKIENGTEAPMRLIAMVEK